jgi:protease-4
MKNFMNTFGACLLAIVAGGVLFFMLCVSMFAALAAAFSPGEAATYLADGTILKIELTETIRDHPSPNPLRTLDPYSMTVPASLSLLDVLEAIDRAADDSRIEGIFLDFSNAGLGMATAEEIRRALVQFRQSGKFIIGYADYYGQGGYYLASAAERLYLNPEGGLDWRGLASQSLFFKGLLDKLGVETEIYRVGAFKSAVEPFMAERMSPENRQQMETLLGTIWNGMVGDVAASRGVDPESLQRYASELSVTDPQKAVELGLVDAAIYRDQVMEELSVRIRPAVEGEEAEAWDGEDPPFISLADYLLVSPQKHAGKPSANQISVIYAEGDIVEGGETDGAVGGRGLAALLADARRDEQVKAVVLRVNSPGGSALASELIWREMTLLQQQKLIVVSMGDYAASGGYWISAPADLIVADRATLTGSIGVFGVAPNLSGALKDKLGITVDVARTNPSADYLTALRGRTPAERAYIQHSVEQVYDTFIDHVSRGRNLDSDRVREIAGGRVWAGGDADTLGLVDGIGGLRHAIEVAADRAGVAADYRIVTPAVELDPLSQLLGLFVQSRFRKAPSGIDAAEAALLDEYRSLRRVLRQDGVQARMPEMIYIE